MKKPRWAERRRKSVERDVMWTPWVDAGLEHLRLVQSDGIVSADSVVIGIEENTPFRIRYEIRCDAGWRVRELKVLSLTGEGKGIKVLADGEGRWNTAAGDPVPRLDGCIDADISATPFTNTLPIRRLMLEPGESIDLAVAYLAVPSLRIETEPQRYTCLERSAEGGTYRLESLDGGFTAELPVDTEGLVLDYPSLFRRVQPR
jgi:hypothetical protein